MIKIFHPIWTKENCAYFSISKWNFDKEKSDEIDVSVYKESKLVGRGKVSKKRWIKTCKHKEKKVVYRPEEPMIYYYNIMKFEQPKTREEEIEEMAKKGTFG